MHQDELTDVYDGYSLWTTGSDRFGDAWPAILRGMGPGDYHPALYAYLAMISTGIGGLSVWSGRLPAALAGVLTVWLVYLVARRNLGSRAALLALLFAALMPIHVLYSRQSHTGLCIQPLFAILMLYTLLRALEDIRSNPGKTSNLIWVSLTGLVIGFSTNAYGAMRLSALLFAILAGFALTIVVARNEDQAGFDGVQPQFSNGIGRTKPSRLRRVVLIASLLTLTVGLGAAPQIHAMVTRPGDFFARASTVVFPLEYGPRWWLTTLTDNFAANLHPHYLFLSFGECSDMTVMRLGIASLPFLYVGLAWSLLMGVWRRWGFGLLLVLSVAVFLLPAAASKPNPNAMRSSGVWALYPLVSAVGAVGLGTLLQSLWARRPKGRSVGYSPQLRLQQRGINLATAAVACVIVAVGMYNVDRYLNRPDLQGAGRQNNLVRLGQWLGEHGARYDRIWVDTDGLFPYFYLAVFSGMTPAEFQKAPREGTVTKYGWEHFHRFGRFRFGPIELAQAEWNAFSQNQSWLVVRRDGSHFEFSAKSHVTPAAAKPGDIHVAVDAKPQT